MGSFLIGLFALVPLLWTTQALALSALIPNNTSGNLTPVDVTAGTAGTPVSLGFTSYSVAPNPNATLQQAYVSDFIGGQVYPLNTFTNILGSPIALPNNGSSLARPVGITFSATGDRAYVAGYNSNAIYVINVSNSSVTTIDLNGVVASGCRPVTSILRGAQLIVPCYTSNEILTIDTANLSAAPQIFATSAQGTGNWTLAYSELQNKLFVGNASVGNVEVFNLTTGGSVATISVVSIAYVTSLAVTKDGGKLYAASGSSPEVYVINAATNAVTTPPVTVGSDPLAGMGLTPDGLELVAVSAGAGAGIRKISTVTDSVTSTISTDIGADPYLIFGDFFGGASNIPTPTVTSISPTSGSTAGGTSITITGTNLTGASSITVGVNACTSVVVTSATSASCTTPAGTAGSASVVVTTGGGSSAANTLYTYVGSASAPTATTSAASSVTTTGATLNGTVNDNGASTTVTFNYGTTVSYGSTATASPSSISAGTGSTSVTAALTGLTCNTLYHYRVSAANNVNTTNGSDATFTTAACPTYTIGGTISGLIGTGLVLTDSTAGSSGPISSIATSFTLPNAINYGTSYAVSVATQPTGQTCIVSNGSGMVAANVTNVLVTCTTNTYTIGGSISGLTASGLVLTDSTAGSSGAISSSATSFTLPTAINSGASYAVSVATQPTGQTCTVNNGSGSNVTANVNSVAVTCSDNPPPTPTITSITPIVQGLTIAFSDVTVASASSTVSIASVNYTAACTSSNGGVSGNGAGAASPITVTNLTGGKSYSCTVSATDTGGTSTSTASAAAIPLAPPTPPNPIPTLGEWAKIVMMLMLMMIGAVGWQGRRIVRPD